MVSNGSSSIVMRPRSRSSHMSAQASGRRIQLAVVGDAGGGHHVRHGPFQIRIPIRLLESRLELREIRQHFAMHRRQQIVRQHRLHDVVGGEDNVPAGIAAHHARQHLFVAFVDAVAHANAEFGFELRNGVGRDVVGPVEDVETRPAIAAAGGQTRRAQQEMAAVHVVAQPLGNQDQRSEADHDQRRDRIHHRIHAAPRDGVNHHGQRFRIDAGHQAGDHVVVERNGEGQQRGGDDSRQNRRQRHVAKCLPFVGAQIERGFFELRVHGAQPRHHHDHDVGDRKRDVRQNHRVHAELNVQKAEDPLIEGQQRNAGDDLRRHQRQVQRAGQHRRRSLPESVGAERADDGGDHGREDRDDQAVPGGLHQLRF